MNGLSDTDPKIQRILDEMWLRTPAFRKMEIVEMLNREVRTLAVAGIRYKYPKAGEKEIHRRLADLLLGPELAEKALGPLAKAI